MTVFIFIPSRTFSFLGVVATELETVSGRSTLLERHVDAAGALAVGLVRMRDEDGNEEYAGVDGGTFVKIGDRVLVSTPRAVVGADLGKIHEQLHQQLRMREKKQKDAQRALARLEIEMARSIFRGDGEL